MDKKMCETTTISVGIMNSKQQLKGKLDRGKNSRFPFCSSFVKTSEALNFFSEANKNFLSNKAQIVEVSIHVHRCHPVHQTTGNSFKS